MRSIIVSLMVSAVACGGGGPLGPHGVPPMPFDADMQPQLSATLAVTTNGQSKTLQTTVLVHNPDGRPRIITFRTPCTVTLRLYRTEARQTPAAWTTESQAGGCKTFDRVDTLAALATRTFVGEAPFAAILNSSPAPTVSPGHYYVSAYVVVRQAPGSAIEVVAGEADISP